MKSRLARAAIGLVLIVASYSLGRMLGREPDSDAWMPFEHTLVGVAQPLAVAFTWLCYPVVLIPIGITLLVFGVLRRAWLARVAVVLFSLLASWRLADAMQKIFMRPRRDDWVYKHETSFSYPSSHAAITLGFYCFLGVLLAISGPGPMRRWGPIALSVVAVGILWSRLALGAHYATDLLGGIFLGAGVAYLSSSLLSI